MTKRRHKVSIRHPSYRVIGAAALILSLTVAAALVAPVHAAQDDPATSGEMPVEVKDCQECHLDVAEHWSHSPHAHAYDDPVFQERWLGMGEPGECLVCHTTDFQQSTGEFAAEGVMCQACHGEAAEEHPPGPVPIKADTEYCGVCHTTTLGEWRLTGHSTVDIGCSDCHDPHSQQPLFEVADDLCLNCHAESMGDYLEDLHVQQGIGCVDCHALVIPPEELPEDGIVPTGHTFTITPATCVACHTDALHAGFSLPGYENGAAAASIHSTEVAAVAGELSDSAGSVEPEAEGITPEQRLQALEAALASQNISLLFQGAIVGLVLGGSTAWVISQNIRRRDDDKENGDG